MQMPKLFTNFLLITFSILNLVDTSIISIGQDNLLETNKYKSSNQNSLKNQRDWTFNDFKKNFGVKYASNIEDQTRNAAYDINIKKLKQNYCSPCGVTSLMDRTQDQLNGLTGLLPGLGDTSKLKKKYINKRFLQMVTSTSIIIPPSVFDWRKYNVVTPIKNQLSCGSCWAFASTAFLESQLIRRNQTNIVIDLAEQFLLQCDNSSYQCIGGYINTAMQTVLFTGLPRQFTYPYNSEKKYQGICTTANYNMKLNGQSHLIYHYSSMTRLSDDKIIQYLLQRPVALAIDATDWRYYQPTSGNRTLKCSQTSSNGLRLNHAVLLIGYTETQWIIKNSWGNNVPGNGWVYVSRDPLHNCGVGFALFTLDYALPTPNF